MTQNQLKYWELQENIRKNKASEGLTASDIAMRDAHNIRSEAETQRHNVQDELLTGMSIKQRAIAGAKDIIPAVATLLLGDQVGLDLSPETLSSGLVRVGDTATTVINTSVEEVLPNAYEQAVDTVGSFLGFNDPDGIEAQFGKDILNGFVDLGNFVANGLAGIWDVLALGPAAINDLIFGTNEVEKIWNKPAYAPIPRFE